MSAADAGGIRATRLMNFGPSRTAVAWMAKLYEGLDDDPETRRLVAATAAARLCEDLLAIGIDEFHFYTLNRAELTRALCHLLGLRPTGETPLAATGS